MRTTPPPLPVFTGLLFTASLLIAGCGSNHVSPAPAAVSSVTVSCSASTLVPGGTSQCSASVAGSGNYSASVDWSVSAGSISAGGMVTAPDSAANLKVTATSTGDTSKSGTASIVVQAAKPKSRHVVLVVEENQSYADVAGNTERWPNLNALIAQGALATNYYGNTHPSIGDYFMMTTGQVLTNDDSSVQVWDVDNIARRLLAAGIPFHSYAEGITQGYTGGNTGTYLARHNPLALLSDVASDQKVANAVLWPFSDFASDVSSGNLPEFSFIVPDADDDAHDGTPQQADTWLQTNVITPLQQDPDFTAGGDGVLIVTFDEATTSDATHGGGHIVTALWGPGVKAGYQQASSTVYQHQSLLATIIELLGLSNGPGSAADAPAMDEFFKGQ